MPVFLSIAAILITPYGSKSTVFYTLENNSRFYCFVFKSDIGPDVSFYPLQRQIAFQKWYFSW